MGKREKHTPPMMEMGTGPPFLREQEDGQKIEKEKIKWSK